MKALIQDFHTLNSISPMEVASYLRSRNWKRIKRLGEKGQLWSLLLGTSEEVEALLPLDRGLGDFAERMSDLLIVLEKVESRSQLEILNDINLSTSDVVRIRLSSSTVDDGSIPMENGVRLVEQAYDLVFAAACAAVQPRPVYQTRKPPQAVDYMKKVKLGQTERGSYVLTIHSIVPPHLQVQSEQGLPNYEEPFERQAMLKLASALAAVRGAAEQAGTEGDLQPFTEVIDQGVSANLCDAIAKLVADSEAQSLNVSFSWSPVRPAPSDIINRVIIASDFVPIIEEAARIFRARTPLDNFEIRGWVVKLERNDTSQPGRATIAAEVEGRVRKIQIELDGSDYDSVVEAHKEGQLIVCNGDLVKEGRNFVLKRPRNLKVENELVEAES